MNKRISILVCMVMVSVFALGCPEKNVGPVGPPTELLDSMQATRQAYQEVMALNPDPADVELATVLMNEAQAAMEAGQYPEAIQKSKLSRLHLERLHAKLLFTELEKYNPPNKLTYFYREQMKVSLDAESAGDLDRAIASAVEARKQATLSLQYLKDCLEGTGSRLAALKEEVEVSYRPSIMVIKTYWETVELHANRQCDLLTEKLNQLSYLLEEDRRSRVNSNRTFKVEASPSFVNRYGEPVMYEKVTDRGLANEVNRVPPGRQVAFIRMLLFSPRITYYYVEDPKTGISGWMAEERVWPERAEEMKLLWN